ncbi:MAG: hypothetical protein ACLGIO_09615, partial [Acidimicrobiia bacterium]
MTRGSKTSVRRAGAFASSFLVAATLAAAPGAAHHLEPQIVETNDPSIYNESPGAVLTETSCPPDGWSGGSAEVLTNVTAHLAWTFTVPEGHTGVVTVVGYRDDLPRPFYFW